MTETDALGNLLRTKRLPLLREGANSGQRNAVLSDALTEAVGWAREVRKPVVAEDLDCRPQPAHQVCSQASRRSCEQEHQPQLQHRDDEPVPT